MYYCPWNGFSCLSLALESLHTHLPFSFRRSSYLLGSVLRQWFFLYLSLRPSVSILPFHCLFTSLHRPCSITLFSSGNELLCLLSALTHPPLAITAYLLSLSLPAPSPQPPLYLAGVHQILSALSGTTATRKFFWEIPDICVNVSVYVAALHVFVCVFVFVWCISELKELYELQTVWCSSLCWC